MADLEIDDPGASILECRINGQDYAIDLAEASDAIRLIEGRHMGDPWSCRECWQEFTVSAEDLLARADREAAAAAGDGWVAARDEVPCKHCGSRSVSPAQAFLDDVSSMLHVRWKVPRLSRAGAAAFYRKVAQTLRDVKKNSIASLASPTGTESTAPPSAS